MECLGRLLLFHHEGHRGEAVEVVRDRTTTIDLVEELLFGLKFTHRSALSNQHNAGAPQTQRFHPRGAHKQQGRGRPRPDKLMLPT